MAKMTGLFVRRQMNKRENCVQHTILMYFQPHSRFLPRNFLATKPRPTLHSQFGQRWNVRNKLMA